MLPLHFSRGVGAESACRLLSNVVRQRNAERLEDVSDLPGDVGPGGDNLAVLLDGRLLKAVEIVEKRLPFGLQAFFLAQAGQFLRVRAGTPRAIRA